MKRKGVNSAFSAVSSSKILIVKHLSCMFFVSGPVTAAALFIDGNSNRQVEFPASNVGSSLYYGSVDTDFLIYSDKRPRLAFSYDSGTSSGSRCTLIGKLVPASATTGFFDD